MNTPESKIMFRAAAMLGGGLVVGGLLLAIGIWLAADRLADQLERGVSAHGVMTRDAGGRVATALQQTTAAVQQHAAAVANAGETISKPQIRVVDPLPIQQPVTIEGPADDGSISVNARIGK
ncbi:MAG: hypothetical protein H0T11_00510 [Chthoniobacterales bacterium]|nr:hypothetical protein [Chthoniobacterales bacterium]